MRGAWCVVRMKYQTRRGGPSLAYDPLVYQAIVAHDHTGDVPARSSELDQAPHFETITRTANAINSVSRTPRLLIRFTTRTPSSEFPLAKSDSAFFV